MAFYHAKNIAKGEMYLRVLEQGRPRGTVPPLPMPKAHITITWVAKDKRRRDIDNLFASMKPYIDGLVFAEVIADDSADCVTYSLRYERGEKDDTIIEVEEN